MAGDAPTFFVPPQPPFRLEPGREAIIGRSVECELRVPSVAASRRHAAVMRRGDEVFVRDLGSTNGTLVNGARIDSEQALASGDRIEVGGVTVTFCRIDPGFAPAATVSADRTAVAFRTASDPEPSALRGDLAMIPLFAVLQMLEMGVQSGVLRVDAGDGPWGLWLASGRLVHAETTKASALEAALEIAQVEHGRFEFTPSAAEPERSFDASVTEVILEATRRIDEANAS